MEKILRRVMKNIHREYEKKTEHKYMDGVRVCVALQRRF